MSAEPRRVLAPRSTRPPRPTGPAAAARATGTSRSARWLVRVYAVATPVALLLTLFVRRQPGPVLLEEVFGLVNVPVTSTFVSVVVLALITRALMGRKRIGLWLVAAFQLFGLYLGVVEQLPGRPLPFAELWRTRGDLGRVLDLAATVLAVVALVWLWHLRPQFTARVRRGSWWLAGAALLAGSAVTVGVAWLLLGTVDLPRSQTRALVGTVITALGGHTRHTVGLVPSWVVDVVAVCAGLTVVGAVTLFLASARPANRWSPDPEVSLRGLVARFGARDSLAYFATRRDRASVFSPDGRAAVTYRVVAGVSLASGDPVGDPADWRPAIEAWRAEAREFGWIPAVLGASEEGARAFAADGMRALLLGDEAVVETARFDLRRPEMAALRQAVRRVGRAGVTVQLRRQRDLDADTVARLAHRAAEWRGGETERGFSMALGRPADPADGDVLHVTAHDVDGTVVGILSFVPWGRRGASLDVMRHSPDAPNGVTEAMICELLRRGDEVGVDRVSLNFCMFRRAFAEADRLGARPSTRVGASLLGVLDRAWQLVRLYRFTERFEPQWAPRFLCTDDTVSLPQVAVAAGAAEGFLPWPSRADRTTRSLDPEHIAVLAELHAGEEPDLQQLGPSRTSAFRDRARTVEAMRSGGHDPYPLGGGDPATPVPGRPADELTVVGRVHRVRDHGSVLFVDLLDTPDRDDEGRQVLAEAGDLGRAEVRDLARLVAPGDLVRFTGRRGLSRTGTPSLLVERWRMEAKCLHPLPFGADDDSPAVVRARSTDLIVHPAALEQLRRRSAVVHVVRDELAAAGFVEVETPMLQPVHGGASARPFRTRSNAYGVDLSLRIAPELYLKRLLVAGMGPVFELGRNFRNEGVDATHNPEFTSLEVYQPHADYDVMRRLTERLVRRAAEAVHGATVLPVPAPGQERRGTDGVPLVDVSGEWPVVRVLDAVSRAVGTEVSLATPLSVLRGIAATHGVEVPAAGGPGAVIEELYADLVERTTGAPTFYTDFPAETSPLARPHRTEPGLAERWDLVVAGMEVATAYSELTDPLEQRRRLTLQSLLAAAGDPEAMEVDEAFLLALETGMPPSGGLGIGVDRLVMMLTNSPIRSVLTFPFVKPLPEAAARRPRPRASAPLTPTGPASTHRATTAVASAATPSTATQTTTTMTNRLAGAR